MRQLLYAVALLLPLLSPAQQTNTLAAEEKAAGWRLLFDGRTLEGWDDPARKTPPGDAWSVEDGCLKAKPHPHIREDLISRDRFRDFELVFDWRIAPGSNSGVKYLIQQTVFLDFAKNKPGGRKFEEMVAYEMTNHPSNRATIAAASHGEEYVISFEYQVVDNARHPDARRGGKYQTGALYSLVAPSQAAVHPVGEFNHSRIVLRGNHVEHWLNGEKVVDTDLDSAAVQEGIAARWHGTPVAGLLTKRPQRECPVGLQNHGDAAWFRNIKIRPL